MGLLIKISLALTTHWSTLCDGESQISVLTRRQTDGWNTTFWLFLSGSGDFQDCMCWATTGSILCPYTVARVSHKHKPILMIYCIFTFLYKKTDQLWDRGRLLEKQLPFWISLYVKKVLCVVDCKTMGGKLLIFGYVDKFTSALQGCLAWERNQRQSRLENGSVGCSTVVFSQLPCLSFLPPASSFASFLLPSHRLHSCWRTSRMSCAPTSPCTSTRRSWSCHCSPLLVAAACAPCHFTSRPPSAPPESISSGRAMLSRPSSLSAQVPWRCWKMAWCWPS